MTHCPTPESNQQQLSLATFSEDLFEQVFLRARTSKLQAGRHLGGYQIRVGELSFGGRTKDGAWANFFYWLITSSVDLKPDYILGLVQQSELHDERETKELIEQLTAGGMTEFGKKVEKMRQERGALLHNAFEAREQAGLINATTFECLEDLRKRTGYEDLDPVELTTALADFYYHRPQPAK